MKEIVLSIGLRHQHPGNERDMVRALKTQGWYSSDGKRPDDTSPLRRKLLALSVGDLNRLSAILRGEGDSK